MTDPTSGGMITRADAQALMPEQVSRSMVGAAASSRRAASARATVGGDGKVVVTGRHVGSVYRAGSLAWRARTRGGKLLGLHASRAEAVGALVKHHEAGR